MFDEPLEPETIATAISMLGVLIGGLLFVALVVHSGMPTTGGLLTILVATGIAASGTYAVPLLLATRRRAAWSGALPGFVSRVALGMRLTPTLEMGVRAGFATGCPLTKRVPRRTGLASDAVLSTTMADLGPAAQRATGLLSAAATAADSNTLLDRAVETALDGTREQMRTYASGLQGPVTAIYAFGVVLPLALVGILPAAPLAGYQLPLLALALALDIFLPVCIVTGTVWLIARRPVVHPPPKLSASHPTMGNGLNVATAGLLGALAGILLTRFLPSWTIWITPTAWGVGAAFLTRYQPAVLVTDSVRTTQAAVPDLLALLGDSMTDGLPPEHALSRASEVPGTAGTIAADARTIQELLGIPVPDALGGDHGPLADLDDRQSAAITALVESASTAGEPGGRALTRYADHLDALAELERSVSADLARITGTLGQTAAIYAPAIGGVTVALATRLRDTSDTLATAGDGFALVVGGYVLVLALVLPALATSLQDGWCRVRIGSNVGRTLLLAGGLFPLTAQFASRLL